MNQVKKKNVSVECCFTDDMHEVCFIELKQESSFHTHQCKIVSVATEFRRLKKLISLSQAKKIEVDSGSKFKPITTQRTTEIQGVDGRAFWI